MTDKKVVTEFKGPGQWRSQAKRLEAGKNSAPTPPQPKGKK